MRKNKSSRLAKQVTQISQIKQVIDALNYLKLPISLRGITDLTSIPRSTIKVRMKQEGMEIEQQVQMLPVHGGIHYFYMPTRSGNICPLQPNELVPSLFKKIGSGSPFDMFCILIGAIARSSGEISPLNRLDHAHLFGAAFSNLLIRSLSKKQKRFGIEWQFPPLRNLKNENNFGHWFRREGFYEEGNRCFSYQPTERALEIWAEALRLFTQLAHEPCDEVFDYAIPLGDLSKLKPRDVKVLLSNCVGIDDGRVLLVDDSNPSESDRDDRTRVYGTISSISSSARLSAGLFGYDVTAAFQAISLQRCDSSIKAPHHAQFIADPKAYRESLVRSSDGSSYDSIKVAMIKLTFGGENHLPQLAEFAEEVKIIRESVLYKAMRERPEDYNYAFSLSDSKDEKDSSNTILFHLLAMDERRIRDAMSECFHEYPLQVHDAVYSFEKVDTDVLEKAVLEKAGFTVKITKEGGNHEV